MCVYIFFLELNHFQINYESHDIAALNTLLHTSKNRHSFFWRTIVLLSHLTKITLGFLILTSTQLTLKFSKVSHKKKMLFTTFYQTSNQLRISFYIMFLISFIQNSSLHYHPYLLLKIVFIALVYRRSRVSRVTECPKFWLCFIFSRCCFTCSFVPCHFCKL